MHHQYSLIPYLLEFTTICICSSSFPLVVTAGTHHPDTAGVQTGFCHDRHRVFVQVMWPCRGSPVLFPRYIFIAQIDQHKVLSVPPLMISYPLAVNAFAIAGALSALVWCKREFIRQQLPEGYGLCRNYMFQRAALCTRENCHVQQVTHHPDVTLHVLKPKWIFKVRFHQDDTTPWPTQGFMGCTGNKMTMFKRGAQ